MIRRPFTQEEREYLIRTHATHTLDEQAQTLNLPYHRVRWRREVLFREGVISAADRKNHPVYTTTELAEIRSLLYDGTSVAEIARRMGRSRTALIRRIQYTYGGVRTVRQSEIAGVRTPSQVAALLGVPRISVKKWMDRGWLAFKRNYIGAPKRKRNDRLITDAMVLDFLSNRRHWPAWHPALMTDEDWREHALRLRHAGEWVDMQTIATRSGLRPAQVYTAWHAGRFHDLTTLVYGREYFIWSDDVSTALERITP